MKSLYQFRMIAKSKEDGSYFTPDIIAFSARDLRSQAYALRRPPRGGRGLKYLYPASDN